VADRSVLILACGNDLRQDDGAGLALAQKLAAANPHPDLTVDLICVHQLMPELALDVARPDVAAVLFVDTRVAIGSGEGGHGESPGADLTMTALDQPVSTGRLGHHVNAQMVLLYARELYAKEVPAWLITVPGYTFDHGKGFSPQVQALLAGADGFIAQVYAQIGA
jgi:hydrogenase maturation protease